MVSLGFAGANSNYLCYGRRGETEQRLAARPADANGVGRQARFSVDWPLLPGREDGIWAKLRGHIGRFAGYSDDAVAADALAWEHGGSALHHHQCAADS